MGASGGTKRHIAEHSRSIKKYTEVKMLQLSETARKYIDYYEYESCLQGIKDAEYLVKNRPEIVTEYEPLAKNFIDAFNKIYDPLLDQWRGSTDRTFLNGGYNKYEYIIRFCYEILMDRSGSIPPVGYFSDEEHSEIVRSND
jgi:hypothetical protein